MVSILPLSAIFVLDFGLSRQCGIFLFSFYQRNWLKYQIFVFYYFISGSRISLKRIINMNHPLFTWVVGNSDPLIKLEVLKHHNTIPLRYLNICDYWFKPILYHKTQGFQYFSSVPVLHYLQRVLCIKIWTFFMNILYNVQHSLKSGSTQYHFKQEKVPGTAPFWKACKHT